MALKILNPGVQPLGQFDGLDSDYLTIKGGEVCQFHYVSRSATNDLSVSDGYDGYMAADKRPVVRLATSENGPFMLADEGVAGYGTLFGSVVGGVAGQAGVVAYGAASTTALGPHTATGSGKVTVWDKPGLYAVTTDAVDSSTLLPSSTTLAPGDALRFIKTPGSSDRGKLTTAAAGANVSSAVVGRFVAFETNGSLVTTPNRLVSAINPTYNYVVIHFNP